MFLPYDGSGGYLVGYLGPTKSNLRSDYKSVQGWGTWVDDDANFNTTTTGIQVWHAPETRSYTFLMETAKFHVNGYGLGRKLQFDYNLTAGDRLFILPGHRCHPTPDSNSSHGGNGGCFTALHTGWYTRNNPDVEVELIYNPESSPEIVGQATLVDAPSLLWAATDFNWYDNPIHATFKSGILYEGWGKVNDKVYHSFPANTMAMHYCPWEMQNLVLNSGHFKVIEDEVDPYEIDADYIFDCRGKPEDFSDYEDLKNPINACILAEPNLSLIHI